MRLIRISNKKTAYVVDAEASRRIFGIPLWRRNRVFHKKKKGGNWVELPREKVPSRADRKKLDFWLSIHNKFLSPPGFKNSMNEI